ELAQWLSTSNQATAYGRAGLATVEEIASNFATLPTRVARVARDRHRQRLVERRRGAHAQLISAMRRAPAHVCACLDFAWMGGSHGWRRVVALSAASALWLVASAAGTGPAGWEHVGSGITSTGPSLNAAVNALSTDAAGTLLVGGAFENAGGVAAADYIAKWDGTRWQALGAQTLGGAVNAIAARGGKVYVGGLFRDAGGNANADYLAVWDGQRWGPACSGAPLGDPVYALQIVGSTLYVGGTFRAGAGIGSADFLVACDLATGTPRS